MDKEQVKAKLNEVVAKAKAAMSEIKNNFKADEDATGARKIQSRFVNLWKSGTPGRVVLIACSVVILLLLVSVFRGCGSDSPKAIAVADAEKATQNKGVDNGASGKKDAASADVAGGDRGMSREEREQVSAQDQIKEIFALAKKSAEEDFNINFGGFFLGMARADAVALAEHYKLKDDEVSITALPGKAVSQIGFSLKGVRRITKGGSTVEELAQAVANRVGDLKGYNGVWSHKTIDGVAVTFSGTGLVIRNDGVAQRNPIATAMALQKEKADRKAVALGIISDMVAIPEGVVIGFNDEDLEQIRKEYKENKELYLNLKYDSEREKRGVHWYPSVGHYIKAWREKNGRHGDGIKRTKGRPFKMGKYEVTQKQWVAVMGYNPSKFKGKDNPVDSVSKKDVKEFLVKLNALPEVKASGLTFRLPMTEEWEFACHAGGKGKYCRLAGGTEITESTLGRVAWHKGNSENRSHPVGKKEPNAFGLYDMLGNVMEYCMDLCQTSEWWEGNGDYFSELDMWRCRGISWSDSYGEDGDSRYGFRLVADQWGAVVQGMIRDMVAIPGKSFKMGKYEVTQKQWVTLMDNNPSGFKGDNNPVEQVSWNDCKVFLEMLNARPEVKVARLTFRLPTEAEWEFACRAGGTGGYCRLADGTEITGDTLSKVAWYEGNCEEKTYPVGQKMPNAFGLYDMIGNVWEWCDDVYDTDGRVCRGRGWRYLGGNVPSQYGDRAANEHNCRFNYLGFRLVATKK